LIAFVEILVCRINISAINRISIEVRTIPYIPRIPTPGIIAPISPRINKSTIPMTEGPGVVPSPVYIPCRIPIKVKIGVINS
jgi:hypothetical protein